MSLSPLEQFEEYLEYEKHYSQHTLNAYKRDLKQFKQWLASKECDDITKADSLHVRNWVASLHRQGISGKHCNANSHPCEAFINF